MGLKNPGNNREFSQSVETEVLKSARLQSLVQESPMNYIPKKFLQLLCDSLVLRVVVLLLVFLLNEQSGAGAAGASFKFVFVLGGILRDAGRILETPIGIN
jgi:hypothetical protein